MRKGIMNHSAKRRRNFLAHLRSASGYKRYLGAPIRYPGGKSAAVGYIVELLPEDVELVISPFIGGGSVEVALANELGIKVCPAACSNHALGSSLGQPLFLMLIRHVCVGTHDSSVAHTPTP